MMQRSQEVIGTEISLVMEKLRRLMKEVKDLCLGLTVRIKDLSYPS